MPLVIVDVHERRSGIACLLEQLGARVEMRRLLSGDYLPAPRTLVERKTVYDLHAAILAGRFWRQMAVLRDSASWTYLLVEGSSLYSGRLSPEAIRGAILALTDLGVIVLRSIDRGDTAAWIYRIAMRRQSPRARDYPPYAQRAYRDRNVDPAERALASAPGVSTVTARRLLERFGSLQAVANASSAELEAVRGVGPRRARAIESLARDSAAKPSA